MRLLHPLGLLLALGVPVLAWGSLPPKTLAELAGASDRIVLARVADQRVNVPGGNVKQMTTISNLEILQRYHGKMAIVDDHRLLVLGYNFTRRDMESSRSFGLVLEDKRVIAQAREMYEADFTRRAYVPEHGALVVSPFNSRAVLARLIQQARRQILIYECLPGMRVLASCPDVPCLGMARGAAPLVGADVRGAGRGGMLLEERFDRLLVGQPIAVVQRDELLDRLGLGKAVFDRFAAELSELALASETPGSDELALPPRRDDRG